ncbi:MAG: 4-carboxymuconolactone decarboxylase [Candidatus Rokuibacteriota bacterium]|nr:MAG: 4-carboxymuconolactone decarboxylase [Candidatus Rokubacteria bacterium]
MFTSAPRSRKVPAHCREATTQRGLTIQSRHLSSRRPSMAASELYQKGQELRRQLLGDAYVERVNQTAYADPMMKKFIDMATETVFGALWTRPGLDLKTRTLICVVSDAATARTPELAIHLRMARRQGWTEDELIEVLLHLSGYVGVPLIREAMLTAKEVFGEMRKER